METKQRTFTQKQAHMMYMFVQRIANRDERDGIVNPLVMQILIDEARTLLATIDSTAQADKLAQQNYEARNLNVVFLDYEFENWVVWDKKREAVIRHTETELDAQKLASKLNAATGDAS